MWGIRLGIKLVIIIVLFKFENLISCVEGFFLIGRIVN